MVHKTVAIVSRSVTEDYKNGWERIFGKNPGRHGINDLSPKALRDAANIPWAEDWRGDIDRKKG